MCAAIQAGHWVCSFLDMCPSRPDLVGGAKWLRAGGAGLPATPDAQATDGHDNATYTLTEFRCAVKKMCVRSPLDGREMSIPEIGHLEEGARPGSKAISEAAHQALHGAGGGHPKRRRWESGLLPTLACPALGCFQVNEVVIPVCTVVPVSGAVSALPRRTLSVHFCCILSPYFTSEETEALAMNPQSDSKTPSKVQVYKRFPPGYQ